MPKFIVVHGSVSGKKVGESIQLTRDQADHINASGIFVRGEGEEELPRARANTGMRTGLDNEERLVKLDGTVIETEVERPFDDFEAPDEDEDEADDVEGEPAPKAKAKAAKRVRR